MYQIDPTVFQNGVFPLPVQVADALPLLSPMLLKAAVCLFRHMDAPISAAALAKETGMSETDAADALRYWEEKQLLRQADAAAPAAEAAPPAAQTQPPAEPAQTEEKTAKKAPVSMRPTKPSYDMICRRMEESAAVRALFSEAQLKLGRTIGTADQASLLTLHDYYGMPAEIILAICEYARLHGKAANMNYIYTVGVDWSQREIDTIEAADAEFKRLEQLNADWQEFRKQTGLPGSKPTPAQEKKFNVWRKEWNFSFEMLFLAFDITMKQTGQMSFPYMNKVLSEWRKKGFSTPQQVEDAEKEFQAQKDAEALRRQKESSPYHVRGAKPAEQDRPASYDIQKAMDAMKKGVPKLKKKK